MSRVFIYGEDGLTLKYTKEKLAEILHELGDVTNPADCTVFFRPSFGRGKTGYGEFDAIIISQKKAYFVEAKWDSTTEKPASRKKPITLKEDQTRRHKILQWFKQNWSGEEGEAWDRFAERYNPEFEKKFTFKNKKGKIVWKSIYPSNKTVSRNTIFMLTEIGNKIFEDALLIFYRDKEPEVEQDGFSIVKIKYQPTHGLFTELE